VAGKKKGLNDDGLGKTARASALKKGGKREGFIPAAPENLKRVISLNNGQHAYILDPRDGKTHHLQVRGAAWNVLIGDLMETEYAAQFDAEIKALGL
jgi:hypothetical protein